MAKTKKPKTVRIKNPERAAVVRRAIMHLLAVCVLGGLLVAGFVSIRRYVDRKVISQVRPPQVVLKNRPPWMSEALAVQIINSIRPWGTYSPFDRRLLVETANILQKNAWIKEVKEVRRAYVRSPGDTLEIDCEYRAPIALVHSKGRYWLVDGDGIKLPEQFTAEQVPSIIMGSNQRVNIRIIEGVVAAPSGPGQKWAGADLAAGLDLVKILFGQPFAEEIIKVNVTNFAGRIHPSESQISLITRYDTEIRWGCPINAKDAFVEISPARKLKLLQQIYADYHRIDAGQPWIDIRLDLPTRPIDGARADGSR